VHAAGTAAVHANDAQSTVHPPFRHLPPHRCTTSLFPKYAQPGLLTPTSPAWLDNLTELYNGLVGRSRPLTSQKVLTVAQLVHTDLMDVPAYRRQLGQRMCELAEQTLERMDKTTGSNGRRRLCVPAVHQ